MLKSLAVASLALALAACASAPTAPQKAAAPPDVIATAAPRPAAVGCVPDTASRIPVKDATCLGFGSVHTGDDMKSTGQTDNAKALQMLDPSVTAVHH